MEEVEKGKVKVAEGQGGRKVATLPFFCYQTRQSWPWSTETPSLNLQLVVHTVQ